MANLFDDNFFAGIESLKISDYASAISSFKLSASSGNSDACVKIGEIYERLRMFDKAYHWYCIAIRKHNTHAMVSVAIFYRYGIYKKKNYRYAFMYNERAAFSGNNMAMLELYELYYFGLGAKRNKWKAIFWLKSAATCGNELAMNSLAGYYLEGFCREKRNFKMAIYWYEKAANSIIFDDSVADLYFFGDKFGQEPYVWQYDRTDESYLLDFDVRAQIILDIMDSEHQDLEKAVYWYRKCAYRKMESAIKKLQYLIDNQICKNE